MSEFTNDFAIVSPGQTRVILPEDLKSTCLMIAKQMAPFDTGNLAEAIYAKRGMNKAQEFSIVYPFREVNYIYDLEFGTGKSTRNVGFIRNNTVSLMVSTIEGYFNENLDLGYSTGLMAGNGFFYQMALKKGYGKHKEMIGQSRYSFADTRNRLQRRMKSISEYNKMFYYKSQSKPIKDDSVYKMARMQMDWNERDRQRRRS